MQIFNLQEAPEVAYLQPAILKYLVNFCLIFFTFKTGLKDTKKKIPTEREINRVPTICKKVC